MTFQLSQCRFARHGLPGVRMFVDNTRQVKLAATDQLVWNASAVLPGAARAGACISSQWQRPVYWARSSDGPMLAKKCCTAYTLMSAQWNALVQGKVE